ncbi:PREDICTED: odorant receptor 46a, isoform A-like isoform X1 [Vollenhovia emeryi]|uniref:odorant receptor 46a, isoform A-like isoform X1 n=1 Tax=Vollenhovia emeryi TaxID=411798 RepID=UPI0005F36FC0|nr:PREDICTED: odorant receptor 46a, isoform A-like isoform X1 [Vollenhovia emeryi]
MLNSGESSVERNYIIHDKMEDKTDLLKHTLALMRIAGCWQPLSRISSYKYKLYNVYTLLLVLILYTFAISQFIAIFLNAGSPQEFTSILYMMMAVCISILKISSMWINRKNFADIINTLTDEPFRPVIAGEVKIRQNFDKMIRNNTLYCFILVESTCVCIILTSLFTNFKTGDLTFKAWLPFNYSSSILFSLAYTHQLISMTTCALINLACDCFICGLLLHICCQIEILEYRLNKSHTWENLRDCVRHHDLIFDFASIVNERFAKIIAIQFIVSMLVVCSNLYQLAQTTLSAKYIPLVIYTFCMMTEIFIYCWFGNEVKLKSLQMIDHIFEMDWPRLNNSFKKAFLMIMNRATIPIEFTSAYLFSMNLESFVGVLRISYSAYTLLQKL